MGLLSRLRNRSTAPSQEAVDLEARSPQTGVKFKDLLVLEQLVGAGADVTEPRHVLHYLYFTDGQSAAAAAADVAALGFETSVREPDGDDSSWALICERHDYTLSLDIVRDSTDAFEAIAAMHSGDYDGWEASV